MKDSDVRADPFVGGDRDPDVRLGYEQVSYYGFDLAARIDQMLSLNSTALQQAKVEIVQHRFRLLSPKLFKSVLTLMPSLWISCGPNMSAKNTRYSKSFVTDVAHTISKRQSIGNCWLYATATWLESLKISHLNESLDISESYWTWWHFYNQLNRKSYITSLNTRGSFEIARPLCQQLELLINDILDISKIEAGKMGVELKSVAICQIALLGRHRVSFWVTCLVFPPLPDTSPRSNPSTTAINS